MNEKPTCLALSPHEIDVAIAPVKHLAAAAPAGGGSASGWKVTQKRGAISGVGVSVSGAGAYAAMSGSMSFSLKQMESSKTYKSMVSKYSISGGVSGFWSWLGFGANASTYHEDINQAMTEMSSSQEVTGTVNVNLMCTGLYPNVQVDASAYVLVLQITDGQGSNTFTVFSNGAPTSDVGAQDKGGNNLPTSGNSSTISIN